MDSDQLNESFFEEILQDYLKTEKVAILEVNKGLAAGKGDNYVCEIYRVFVRYRKSLEDPSKKEEESVSLIVKLISPKNIGIISSKTMSEMFRKEFTSFVDVLPRVEKFVGSSLAPQLFYNKINTNFLVMEDLATKGFAIQDRKKCLSLAHTLVALEKIALFYAGTVALAEEKPQLIRSFNDELIQKLPETFIKLLIGSIQKISEGVEKWNEYKQAASKLKKIKEVFKLRLLEVYKFEPEEFCVLNHGDLWTTNILFRHDEKGHPTDALFVDFQTPIYTSPAIDLQHFLAMCPEIEIRYEQDEYFLQKYIEILEITMKKIGCKTEPPKLEELKVAMYKRRVYTILTGLIYYTRSVADSEDVESLDQVLESGDTNLDFFKNPDTVKAVSKIVKILNERGYLD